ncbi:hypothetical protein PMI16_02751 [Herbaspirillum sp. CF444]|uniref:hypothetical protein n=1 Tax=Herbaspirillum sp. CF444 TaxID=1144319 RepID=UPI0002726E9B|nr:hypothetical protein [Herbaspirillum sp. CF444]EJL87864.1 hypothetical protein PMI16_02751 [Herbaspirillum sp. CF444]
MPGIDSPVVPQKTLFQPFSWHTGKPRSSNARLAELCKDIGCGIATVLQFMEFDDHETLDGRPLFSKNHRAQLLRLAMASATLLSNVADREIDRRNARREKVDAE